MSQPPGSGYASTKPMNRLLAALPPAEMEVLRPDLEEVSLPFKQSLYEVDQPVEYAYFLHWGVASMTTPMENGTEIEVATVGPEGMVGLPVYFDALIAGRGFMQVPGEGARIKAEAFKRALEPTPHLRWLLGRYTLALVNQLAQNSACNRMHEAEQRLARWLLLTQDRAHSTTFP